MQQASLWMPRGKLRRDPSRNEQANEVKAEVSARGGGGRGRGWQKGRREWMDQMAGQAVRSANADTAAAARPVPPGQRASLRARV